MSEEEGDMDAVAAANTEMPTLAENVVRLRDQMGIDDAELARRSDVSPATISRLLSDPRRKPTWETIEKLARALEVNPSELTGRKMPVKPEPRLVVRESAADYGEAAKMPLGLADPKELLHAYVTSPWCAKDRATPAELDWIGKLPKFIYRGPPPDGEVVHDLLMKHRRGEMS